MIAMRREGRFEAVLALVWVLALTAFWFAALVPAGDIWQTQALMGLYTLLACLGVGIILRSRTLDTDSGEHFSGLVVVIVMVAACYRFYGLNFGLPAFYHPDEFPKALAIERMSNNGNLDPQYFLHPSLLLYLGYFNKWLLGVFGVEGSFRELAVMGGRIVSATAGTLTVYLTWLVGRNLFSPLVGVFGAALLAVSPLHITSARYMKEDALLTCMVMLCLALVLAGVESRRRWLVLLGGFCGGMAAASKYSGVLVVIIVSAIPWLQSRSFKPDLKAVPLTILAILMIPVGFLVCVPYSILNNEKFVIDFLMEKGHMERGHSSAVSAWSQYWMYHFSRSIIPGLTKVVACLGVIGFGLMIRERRFVGYFLLGCFLLFYMPGEWVKAKPAPQPERYVYPCLPFVCVAAGYALAYFRQTATPIVVQTIVCLAVLMPAVRSMELASELVPDTRRIMGDWIASNIPAGSKLYFDWRPYSPDIETKDRELFTISYITKSDYFNRLKPRELESAGQDYLVISTMAYARFFTEPNSSPAVRGIYRELVARYPIVHEVRAKSGSYGFSNPVLTMFSLKSEDRPADVVLHNLGRTEVPWLRNALQRLLDSRG